MVALGHMHLTPIGGSDDHHGGANETKEGPWDEGSAIGNPTTMVLAANLSHPAVIEGVSLGRTVVKMFGSSDPMVELTASTESVSSHVGSVLVAAVGQHNVTLTTRVTLPPPRPPLGHSGIATATMGGLEAPDVDEEPMRSAAAQGYTLALVRNNANEYMVSVEFVNGVFEFTVSVLVPTAGIDRWRAVLHAGSSFDGTGASTVGAPHTITNHVFVTAEPSASGKDVSPRVVTARQWSNSQRGHL
jgi:hypothetical protein